MTEMDYLKMKLEDKEKAFDKLFKRHMDLLKQQGELEKEKEQLKKQLNELNKYCTACDDTLTTIQELTYKLLTIDFENAESKADYCRLLNELDNKDLSFIHDCIEAINKCDLMKMEELKREYGDSE